MQCKFKIAFPTLFIGTAEYIQLADGLPTYLKYCFISVIFLIESFHVGKQEMYCTKNKAVERAFGPIVFLIFNSHLIQDISFTFAFIKQQQDSSSQ